MKNKFLVSIIFIPLLFCIIWSLVSNIRAGIVDETTPPDTEIIVPNNPTPVGDNATITITDSEGNIFDYSIDNFIVGNSYIVSATANEGYNNPTIQVNGVEQSNPYTFTVEDTSPIVLTASANINTYSVTVSGSTNATLQILDSENNIVDYATNGLAHGQAYKLSAIANEGYTGAYLTILNVGTWVNGAEYTVSGDIEIVLSATLKAYDMSIGPFDNATISFAVENGTAISDISSSVITQFVYGVKHFTNIAITITADPAYVVSSFDLTMGGITQSVSIVDGIGTCTIPSTTGNIAISNITIIEEPTPPIDLSKLHFVVDSTNFTASVSGTDSTITSLEIPSTISLDAEGNAIQGTDYSITAISVYGFAGFNQLSTVVIPNTVILIDEMSFSSCSNLEFVVIPSSVTSINSGCFENCPSSTIINYTGTQEQWESINMDYYTRNTCLGNLTINYNYVA